MLSSGAGTIGNRSGQQVDLRFYAGVNGFYNSSIQPVAVDSKGNLITINGLEGVSASLGLYGTHSWRTALLGVDYEGNFQAYIGNSAYDGTNQSLVLGYTLQESRRLSFSGQLIGGIFSNALGGIGILAATPSTTSNVVAIPTTLLFDSRAYYVQGGLDVTYTLTPRTSFTFGGQGFEVWRQSQYLVGMEGYNARGTVEHKLNKNTSVGFTYQRQHFDFPKAFGQADIDSGELFVGTNLGARWQLTVRGGVYHAEVKGLQTVALNPVVAALLGQSSSTQAFYQSNFSPSGQVSLTRKFKMASLNFSYAQMVVPGNGVYLTSKADTGSASYGYTGIRKVSSSVSGGYNSLSSIGQGIPPYKMYNGGAGMTYTLPYSLHLTGRYDYIYQDIPSAVYKHAGYMATIGVTFSPGKVPLSLW